MAMGGRVLDVAKPYDALDVVVAADFLSAVWARNNRFRSAFVAKRLSARRESVIAVGSDVPVQAYLRSVVLAHGGANSSMWIEWC
jgi:hypothetical protein